MLESIISDFTSKVLDELSEQDLVKFGNWIYKQGDSDLDSIAEAIVVQTAAILRHASSSKRHDRIRLLLGQCKEYENDVKEVIGEACEDSTAEVEETSFTESEGCGSDRSIIRQKRSVEEIREAAREQEHPLLRSGELLVSTFDRRKYLANLEDLDASTE